MDQNYLLFRHQVELARSTSAASIEARTAHAKLARAYAGLIAMGRAGSVSSKTAAVVSESQALAF